MSIGKVLTETQKAEYKALYEKFALAVVDAAQALNGYGLDSEQFQSADKAAASISAGLLRIQGRKSWF